jgi:hypothetical protein
MFSDRVSYIKIRWDIFDSYYGLKTVLRKRINLNGIPMTVKAWRPAIEYVEGQEIQPYHVVG